MSSGGDDMSDLTSGRFQNDFHSLSTQAALIEDTLGALKEHTESTQSKRTIRLHHTVGA